MNASVGTLVAGRYELLSRIGFGGMGSIWSARDILLGDELAVKVMTGTAAGTEERTRRFLRELRHARRVAHANVCRVFDVGLHENVLFMTMELVRGSTLASVLKSGPLSLGKRYSILLQIASGLEAIHSCGLVHRDLKPLNVMLDADGVARILDFGIAKDIVAPNLSVLTQEGSVIGTPAYMSPEQLSGKPLDARTDVYSFGVMAFEILSGNHPGEHFPIPPSRARTLPTLARKLEPPNLSVVVSRCVAPDPESRFASAASLRRAIAALMPTMREDLAEAAAPAGVPPALIMGCVEQGMGERESFRDKHRLFDVLRPLREAGQDVVLEKDESRAEFEVVVQVGPPWQEGRLSAAILSSPEYRMLLDGTWR